MNAMDHIELGDVFSSIWGYDQTNVDFYRVTRKTASMVELSPIPSVQKEALSWASASVAPDLDAAPGAPIGLRRPRTYGSGAQPDVYCKIASYAVASKIWDPKNHSSYCSWYG